MTTPLPLDRLRWRCPPESLDFETTADVEPIQGVVGQSEALDALAFGLGCRAPAQNVFVRGLAGSGRMTLVRHLIDTLTLTCPTRLDRCYVHDFERPDRPRLLSLPADHGRRFRRRMRAFAKFVDDELPRILESEVVAAEREAIQDDLRQRLETWTGPFQQALLEAGLALVQIQAGPTAQNEIVPLHDGKPIPLAQLQSLVADGTWTAAEVEKLEASRVQFGKELDEISRRARNARREAQDAEQKVVEQAVRQAAIEFLSDVRESHPDGPVREWLDAVVEHTATERLRLGNDGSNGSAVYEVNVLLERSDGNACPVIAETAPSLPNLLGSIEPEWRDNRPVADHRSVRAGALLRADGGFLILEARDVLAEPGAWHVLMRTLRTGRLEIVPSELGWPFRGPSLQPEPIPVDVRVILVGDAATWAALDTNDPDFGQLFKVLADFETVIDREPGGAALYAGMVARIQQQDGLPPFDRGAVATLTEHGARVASRPGKLTARFGRIGDLAREAAWLANQAGAPIVANEHVVEAIRRTKRRGSLPSRRFQELIAQGTIRIQTRDEVVGQVNGLAVMHAGPLTYGFPARITASIGAGHAGVVDIEGAAALSGSIHTKGFHILGGLLRYLLQTDHPLAFSASLAFEQSYGGIDGDSASGAEVCCLLSALTGVPIRQSIAMTGAIDQLGAIQAIGGVNEKIEGFFDACAIDGLTGDQGVIVPQANVGELMLRLDVVEACRAGMFAVFAVDDVRDALELLTGMPAGARETPTGEYPPNTLLRRAVDRAHEFWQRSHQSPQRP